MKSWGLAALAAVSCTESASAASYVLNVSGKVTDTFAFANSNANPPTKISMLTGLFDIGSIYSLNALFDINTSPTILYDSDPSINIYYLKNVSVTFSIGSFSTNFSPIYDFDSLLQIWDNRDPSSYNPSGTDAQSFGFFDYNPVLLQYPFDLGSGQYSMSIDADLFDPTGSARSNDSYSVLAPSSSFSSKIASFGVLNSSTNLYVGSWLSITDYALTSSVPEPASWAMMIGGFGLIGATMRRKRITVSFA